jgi:hypothetical protein
MPYVHVEKSPQGCPPNNLICFARDSVWTDSTLDDVEELVAQYYFGGLEVQIYRRLENGRDRYTAFVEGVALGNSASIVPFYNAIRRRLLAAGYVLA